MIITFQDFMDIFTGRPCDWDGYYGSQCMDEIKWYLALCLGNRDWELLKKPTARLVWTDFDQKWANRFTKIANTPDNFPEREDIVIWGNYPTGHIAICVNANKDVFDSFDTNWIPGSYPCVVHHNYKNVLGWLRFIGERR